jgi:hypothetical protein
VKFHKQENGVFAFFLVFEGFLFSYFEIPEFSIVFLSFWGFLIFLCEVSQGGEIGYLLFFL